MSQIQGCSRKLRGLLGRVDAEREAGPGGGHRQEAGQQGYVHFLSLAHTCTGPSGGPSSPLLTAAVHLLPHWFPGLHTAAWRGERGCWSPGLAAAAGKGARSGPCLGPGPEGRCMPSPARTHPHRPGLDGRAILVQAAWGTHVGPGFLGQQVPAGILAKVACWVSRIQDDGPAKDGTLGLASFPEASGAAPVGSAGCFSALSWAGPGSSQAPVLQVHKGGPETSDWLFLHPWQT